MPSCSIEITEVEALGVSNIFRKLLLFFPPSVLVALPEEMLRQLVDNLTALTLKFAQGAAHEEMLDHEDQLYMEAFEQMLQSWVCILQESSSCNSSQVKQSATLIFDTYLKCHLAPPDGSRVAVSVWHTFVYVFRTYLLPESLKKFQHRIIDKKKA
ncbi:Exportin-4 [Portunus trituberculatus]|uniref:Exportin-4 n=1 Tax=Portunus trituberculatus TaxID=210409 RepID=A0A5B7ISX1_PORTR|nr:Exportin-4 [Portunus trituberculatus]